MLSHPIVPPHRSGKGVISAGVMEELLAEVNLCSGAGAADLDRLAADQRVLLIQVRNSAPPNICLISLDI